MAKCIICRESYDGDACPKCGKILFWDDSAILIANKKKIGVHIALTKELLFISTMGKKTTKGGCLAMGCLVMVIGGFIGALLGRMARGMDDDLKEVIKPKFVKNVRFPVCVNKVDNCIVIDAEKTYNLYIKNEENRQLLYKTVHKWKISSY